MRIGIIAMGFKTAFETAKERISGRIGTEVVEC